MAWRTAKVEDQRLQFIMAVSRKDKPFNEVCKDFEISRPTGYLWWNRYQAEGACGIQDRSRRPHSSPGKTPKSVEEHIEQLRQQRPDWGARKIQVLLKKEHGVQLPASTIHQILLRRDLVREGSRHRPAIKRFEREAPNDLWQMDFKGPKHWNQRVGPLSILDDHSRYLLGLQGDMNTRGEEVKAVLERVFQECGLPEQMLMDHGCPWWNDQGVRGWTRLAVWIMKQGIGLCFSGYNHPQTQGKVEFFHRSLAYALLRRGTPPEDQRQPWLDEFRYEYNHVRPHQALQMDTPGQRWKKSERCFQSNPPEWKYPEGYEASAVTKNGEAIIDGHRYWISGALAGEQIGWIECENRILLYYRKTLIREINLSDRTATKIDF